MPPALRRERALGALVVIAACVYMIPFAPRGWIPHDEGMLGQAADRVMHGGIPHVDYEEAYTGGLSWAYALVFRTRGVDVVNIRWLLLVGGCATAWLVYAISRRYLRPIGAALAAWVAIAWSFPNYFSGIPSWWLLVCALVCAWAFIRYVETEHSVFIALAGLAAGAAIAIKQTGVYVFVALMLTLLHATGPRLLARIAAAAAAALAAIVLAPRIFQAEGLYLFLPAAACALTVFVSSRRLLPASTEAQSLALVAIASAVAALPVACLLMPYVLRHRLWDFVNGAFVLPQKRLEFASAAMPGAWLAVAGLPLVALIGSDRIARRISSSAVLRAAIWMLAIALPIAALWNAVSYQVVWQSARASAAFLPIVACWRIARGRIDNARERAIVFVLVAMLAWSSLNQFPFAAPIYFSYVAPLAVVATVAVAANASSLQRDTILPWAVMLLMFGVLSTNRGYIESLGVAHVPRRFDAPLQLPRAHLLVSDNDAHTYREVVASIGRHLRGGQLVAGPDCPEVYFLAGLTNPSGALFDFLSDGDADDAARWLKGDTIVVNHAPHFTARPSEPLLATLRREFPHHEDVGRFEIRWR